MEPEVIFMRAALREAAKGLGCVEPNPMVGAAIVAGGRIVGARLAPPLRRAARGNRGPGGCREAGCDVRGATMYVSLEPCCHRDKKTPPCTEALIAAGLGQVVAAMEDPDPNVAGAGVAALRAAGMRADVAAAPPRPLTCCGRTSSSDERAGPG